MYKVYTYLPFLTLCLLGVRLTADQESFLCTSSLQQEHMANDQQQDALIKLANDYLLFINDVGSPQSVMPNDPRLELLFAKDLTKIDNTLILFEKNRDALLPQMRSFEGAHKSEANTRLWIVDIHNALIIPSPKANTVVVNFEWVHAQAGKGTTVAILKRNTSGKIEHIKDIWTLIKNKTSALSNQAD